MVPEPPLSLQLLGLIVLTIVPVSESPAAAGSFPVAPTRSATGYVFEIRVPVVVFCLTVLVFALELTGTPAREPETTRARDRTATSVHQRLWVIESSFAGFDRPEPAGRD